MQNPPDALAYAPVLVRRLQRVRELRRSVRAGVRLEVASRP